MTKTTITLTDEQWTMILDIVGPFSERFPKLDLLFMTKDFDKNDPAPITLTDEKWTMILDMIGSFSTRYVKLNEIFVKIKTEVYPDED